MRALRFSVSIPQYTALKLLGGMRRLYLSGPLATTRLAEIPEPTLPPTDWVKIRTLLCGLCGTDMNLIFLRDSPTATPFTSFPCTLGHEICGQITEVGTGVDGVKPGEVVTVCPPLGCSVRGIEPKCRSCEMGRPSNCENFAEGSLAPGLIMGLCRDVGGTTVVPACIHYSSGCTGSKTCVAVLTVVSAGDYGISFGLRVHSSAEERGEAQCV